MIKMRSYFKKLLLWFVFFFIAKSILSYFIGGPSIFGDEYLYSKLARSLFLTGQYTVHDIPLKHFPPLYPLVISISYLFENMNLVYASMKVINSFGI